MNLFQISRRTIMMRRKFKYFLWVFLFLCMYYFFGVNDYIQSKSFDNFDYPLNVDIRNLVDNVLAGNSINETPINIYPYRFLSNSGKCASVEKLDLFIIVKSAMNHFGHRDAIRQTYGSGNIPKWTVRSLFFLGSDVNTKTELQKKVYTEMVEHKDVIQMDFIDDYFNNTIKTMMSFRWLYEHCAIADYYLFTDDDMYISVNNLLNYVQNIKPKTSPSATDKNWETFHTEVERDRNLFAGYVFDSAPQRFLNSKWRVSLEEYQWNKWPPYVTAGAYVLDNKTMKMMYVASLFVKHFRFDDIYLAIVAKKLGIVPTHCAEFYFYKKKYSKEGYRNVIASHGYSDHKELIKVWNEQNVIETNY